MKKTYTYTFDCYRAWTSYSKLSAEEAESIERVSVNDFPTSLKGENVEISDIDESIRWCDAITKNGYAKVHELIKIKKWCISHSPDYFKRNGCGNAHFCMKIISKVPLEFDFES